MEFTEKLLEAARESGDEKLFELVKQDYDRILACAEKDRIFSKKERG